MGGEQSGYYKDYALYDTNVDIDMVITLYELFTDKYSINRAYEYVRSKFLHSNCNRILILGIRIKSRLHGSHRNSTSVHRTYIFLPLRIQ